MKVGGRIDAVIRILGLGALMVWLSVRLGGEGWHAGHPTALTWMLAAWATLMGGALARWEPGWSGLGRHAFLAGAATYAVWPFLDAQFSGAGDAYDYSLQVADYVSQLRSGIWPIFVGQSAYGFIGTVHTLRTAPAFTHLAGLCDVLTLRGLSFLAVLKLTLFMAGVGGGLSMYLVGRRILGAGQANAAAALAALYLWSPGVLAPLYLSDMYATFTAIPWLPWVMAGLIRISERPDRSEGWIWWGLGMGGLWWSHAPTAMWALLVSGLILGLAWRPHRIRDGALVLLGVGLAAALGGYVFVSVWALHRASNPADAVGARAYILDNFGDWRERWGPAVSIQGADVQFGWQIGLGVVGAGLIGVVWGWRIRAVAAMSAAGAGLWLLLGIWPAAGALLWRIMPAAIVEITSNWPAQRFAGLISVLALGVAAIGWRQRQLERHRVDRWGLVYLGLLLAWSAREASVYQRRIDVIRTSPEASKHVLDPERITFGRASAQILGNTNPYFSQGHMEAAAEYRWTAGDNGPVWADGITLRRGEMASVTKAELIFRAEGANMAPAGFAVPAGGAILTFDFHGSSPHGILELKLPNFTLDFVLPNEPMSAAGFGAGPNSRRSVLLRNPDPAPRALQVLFWPRGRSAVPSKPGPWASLQLQRWDPAQQVVRIRQLMPTVLELDAEREGWLESPKVWIPGYAAQVDGQSVPVRRSAHGVVAVPVPAGRHVVALAYRGSWALRLSYMVSLAAWLMVILRAAATWMGRYLYIRDGRLMLGRRAWLP